MAIQLGFFFIPKDQGVVILTYLVRRDEFHRFYQDWYKSE